MNRLVRLVSLAGVTGLALLSCRIEQAVPGRAPTPPATVPGGTPTTDTGAASVQPSPSPTPSADSLYASVRPLQDSVYVHPKDSARRAVLLAAAFDSASGSFFVVGKGVANPTRHDQTGRQGQVRASESDAKRWALYLKAWHTGDTRLFGERIRGEVTYSTTLLERTEGDTLYQLLQIPVGSVTVR